MSVDRVSFDPQRKSHELALVKRKTFIDMDNVDKIDKDVNEADYFTAFDSLKRRVVSLKLITMA